jgi:hypothetical protein
MAVSQKNGGEISTMNDLLVSFFVFALIFGGALLGAVVRPLLSEQHLHPDSRDVVKMTTGLIGTLAALVLGLLIASAKSTFDQKTNQVRQLTATVILLDDLLMQYGPEATPVRNLLRQSIRPLANRIWHEEEVPAGRPVRFESSAESLAFENELERLSPKNDTQHSLQARAIQAFTRTDPTAVVRADRRLDSCSVPGDPGFLAQRDFRELHPVRANQSNRDHLPVCRRAVVCRRDLSGFGTR